MGTLPLPPGWRPFASRLGQGRAKVVKRASAHLDGTAQTNMQLALASDEMPQRFGRKRTQNKREKTGAGTGSSSRAAAASETARGQEHRNEQAGAGGAQHRRSALRLSTPAGAAVHPPLAAPPAVQCLPAA